MIDVLPYVAELLAPLGAQIEPCFRDTFVTFPLIVLSRPSYNPTISDKTEIFKRILVQVDAYTLDKSDTDTLAQQIDEIMLANGFKLSNSFPATEGNLEREQMTFTCNLDYNNRIMTM